MELIQILGFLVIVLFYGSYFEKMLSQRRHGITTDRMGRGEKPKHTLRIEVLLKVITFTMTAVQLLSIIVNAKWFLLAYSNTLRYVGIVIALSGVTVFIIAMITMRESWRAGVDSSQKTTLVKDGIYRFSRNPAFLGFDLFYIGFTAAFSNALQICFLLLSVTVLHLQIIEEEKFLPTVFGEEYINYKRKTGRYFSIKGR
ncbi:MAG: isoprenylcysteine carboxylmethyltransferase family protein [Bacillota bacterium]|nr:isoprenylcysteine carboxylmethyltransferase family protein [Bacillota bacterium]